MAILTLWKQTIRNLHNMKDSYVKEFNMKELSLTDPGNKVVSLINVHVPKSTRGYIPGYGSHVCQQVVVPGSPRQDLWRHTHGLVQGAVLLRRQAAPGGIQALHDGVL